jgi:hypothetical protein
MEKEYQTKLKATAKQLLEEQKKIQNMYLNTQILCDIIKNDKLTNGK